MQNWQCKHEKSLLMPISYGREGGGEGGGGERGEGGKGVRGCSDRRQSEVVRFYSACRLPSSLPH